MIIIFENRSKNMNTRKIIWLNNWIDNMIKIIKKMINAFMNEIIQQQKHQIYYFQLSSKNLLK